MNHVKLIPLSTAKGSSTRGGVVLLNGCELLFSYETLVGVQLPNGNIFYQKDGLASSRTTARHINNWLKNKTFQNVERRQVSEPELLNLAGMA